MHNANVAVSKTLLAQCVLNNLTYNLLVRRNAAIGITLVQHLRHLLP